MLDVCERYRGTHFHVPQRDLQILIRLFTSLFKVHDASRRDEYAAVMARNIACKAIDEVCVIVEGGAESYLKSPKLRIRRIESRPTYADFFQWANELAGPEDISIVANADIYLDDQFALFRHWLLPEGTAFILAPWDVGSTGTSSLRYRNDSQDTWIFRGTIRAVAADFQIGVPRCDNRLAVELTNAGYKVRNPAFSLRTNHLHFAEHRSYLEKEHSERIPPPYGYRWPENLWSLPRTLAYNARHPSAPLDWRLDKRRLASRLKLHRISKVLGIRETET